MARMPQYAAKRDANEGLIVDALRGVGAVVVRLSSPGLPDLLVGYRVIVRSWEEALDAIGATD